VPGINDSSGHGWTLIIAGAMDSSEHKADPRSD
jgi:hypothetical protein